MDVPKKLRFGFLDILIFGFLDFFGFLAISRQRKELPEIRWCQNDRIFEGFLDFPKKITFWISGFLDFRIFLDFWIFWISGYISAMKRATGDFLMSKRPEFQGLFGFSKKMTFLISGFRDFWISGFLLQELVSIAYWAYYLTTAEQASLDSL